MDEPDDDHPSVPPPPPDDRLWRHPSEMFASAAPDPAPTTSERKRLHPSSLAIAAVVLAVAGVATVALVADTRHAGGPNPRSTPAEATTTAAATSPRARAVDAVAPAVVAVTVDDAGGSRYGSGVVVRPDGLIVTSAALVGDADTVHVAWASGREEPATVAGRDEVTGLAALSVDASGLTAVDLDDGPVRPGESCVTVAAWRGATSPSIARAVVTSGRGHVDDASERLFGLISTTRPVPRWADGGALVDDAGHWRGISLTLPDATDAGWAVPARVAVRVAEDLRSSGQVDRGWLGVRGVSSTLGPSGVLVVEVPAASPAADAGVVVGDVVTSVHDEVVRSYGDLRAALTLTRPGDEVTIRVERDGRPVVVTATLATAPR